MAGSNVIKVTTGPEGTSWLRCSASELNRDCKKKKKKKKKSFVFLPALGLQTKEAVFI